MSDRVIWTERHKARVQRPPLPPSPFIVEAMASLEAPRPQARALDLACGAGRHALVLARAGYAVLAVDWAVPALRTLGENARRGRLAIACLATDVSTYVPPENHYDVVLSTNFLDRSCLQPMRRAVARGGVLLLETFLEGQERYGHPSNPEYLLHRGEIENLCRGWDILLAHEGLLTRGGDAAMMAGVLARRPGSP